MEPLSNSFKKGMNKDVDSYELNNEIYSDALNMTPATGDGNNGPLNNYFSNKYEANLSYLSGETERELIPIASKSYDGIHYICCVDKEDTSISVIGTFPSPNYGGTGFVNEFKPLNVKDNGSNVASPFVTTKLGFHPTKTIDMELRLEYNNTINIYFVFEDKNGYINSGFVKEGLEFTEALPIPLYKDEKMFSQLSLQPTAAYPVHVKLNNIIDGALKPGNYVFYFTYLDEGFNETQIIGQSYPVTIFQGMGTVLAKVTGGITDFSGIITATNKGIQLRVENIDLDFKYLQVYIEHKTGEFGEVNLYYKMDYDKFKIIDGQTVFTSTTNSADANGVITQIGTKYMLVNYKGTEAGIEDSSIGEINSKQADIKSAITNAQLDNKYYIANTESNMVEDDVQTILAFARKITLSEDASHTIKVPGRTKAEIYDTVLDQTNGGYANAFNLYNKLGYWSGEAYQLGIQLLKPNLQYTGAFPIQGNGRDNLLDTALSLGSSSHDGIFRFKKRQLKNLLNDSGVANISALRALFPAWNDTDFEKIRESYVGFRLVRAKRNNQCIAQGYGLRGYAFPNPFGHNANNDFFTTSGIENREYRARSGGYALADVSTGVWKSVYFPAFMSEIGLSCFAITNRTKGGSSVESLRLSNPDANDGWDEKEPYGRLKPFKYEPLVTGDDDDDNEDLESQQGLCVPDTTLFVNLNCGNWKYTGNNNHVYVPGYYNEDPTKSTSLNNRREYHVNLGYGATGLPDSAGDIGPYDKDLVPDGQRLGISWLRKYTLDFNCWKWCLFSNDLKTGGTSLINQTRYNADTKVEFLGTVNFEGENAAEGRQRWNGFKFGVGDTAIDISRIGIDAAKLNSVALPFRVEYTTGRSGGNTVDWNASHFKDIDVDTAYVQTGHETTSSTPNGFTAYLDFIAFNYGRMKGSVTGVFVSVDKSFRDCYGIIKETFVDDYLGLNIRGGLSDISLYQNNIVVRTKHFPTNLNMVDERHNGPSIGPNDPNGIFNKHDYNDDTRNGIKANTPSENIAYDNGAMAACLMNLYDKNKYYPTAGATGLKDLYDFENETFIPITQAIYFDSTESYGSDKTAHKLNSSTLSDYIDVVGSGVSRQYRINNIFQGDCYVGIAYHRLYKSKWTYPSKDGTLDSPNGALMGVAAESNWNPYLRVDYFFSSNEENYKTFKSATVMGLRRLQRSFFPYYAGVLNSKTDFFDFAFYHKIAETGRRIEGQSSLLQSLVIEPTNPEIPFSTNRYPTRIWYTGRYSVNDITDSYRKILPLDFQDYDLSKGPIMKILNFKNMLFSFQHNQINIHDANDRIEVASDSAGSIYATTDGRLSQYPKIVSGRYGVQYTTAVIASDNYIYGIDTNKKKIFQIDAQGGFKIISDLVIASFINNSLNPFKDGDFDMENKAITCGYNAFNNDVYFSFYDLSVSGKTLNNPQSCFTLAYNELVGSWTCFMSFIPALYLDGRNLLTIRNKGLVSNDKLFSWNPLIDGYVPEEGENYEGELIDDENESIYQGQKTINLTEEGEIDLETSTTAEDNKTAYSIWSHNIVKNTNGSLARKNVFYDRLHKNIIEYVVNNGVELQKILNNIEVYSNNIYPDKIEFIIEDIKMIQDIKYHPQMRRIRNAVYRVDRLQIIVNKYKIENGDTYVQDISDDVKNIMSVINAVDVAKNSRVRNKSIKVRITYLKNSLKKFCNTDNSGDIRISKINSFVGITKF